MRKLKSPNILRRGFIVAAFLFLPLVWLAAFAQPQQKVTLTVSAAVSLKEALDEIAAKFKTAHPDAQVRFNLGASGTLQRQIEQGAPVDIFISASADQMDSLAAAGLLVPGTRRDLLSNKIVLIVPQGKSAIADFQDLTRPEVKVIAVGEPKTVPAGKYAQEVLKHFGSYDQLKPKLVLANDVRQVLNYVATGNADAGMVYITDAKTSSQVKVVAEAPEDSHSPIIYPIAVLKSSKNPTAAKQLIDFLFTPEARAIFEKYAFTQ